MGECRFLTLLPTDLQRRAGHVQFGHQNSWVTDCVTFLCPGLGFRDEKYLRADSAFCNEDVIRVCITKGVRFTITAHGNIGWESRVDTIDNWAPNLRFFIIVKRTWVEREDLFGQGHWKYYAIITNRSQRPLQELMEFHHKRGNAENFLREEKYGYDLKHFPCLKLSANHAYGLMAMVAHNFLRTIGILENPHKPKFARRLRYEFINIPGHLVRHARGLTLKIPKIYHEEVSRLIRAWRSTPYPSLNSG